MKIDIKRFGLFAMVLSLIILSPLTSADAQFSNLTSGLNYLVSTQNSDGSWGSDADFAILDTSAVLDTLKVLSINSPAYSNGTAWLNLQSPIMTDFLSRKILTLSLAGMDVSADLSILLAIRNSDGGWGGDNGAQSMVIDTSLALQALRAVNYPDNTVIGYALSYLIFSQNSDGGFGFYQGDVSNVYMTALVSLTLQQFPQASSLATAINKATTYLASHQNIDGGFGSPSTGSPSTGSGQASTVIETAYAYMALAGVTTDGTVLGNAVNYLKTTQSSNGSWLDDPYSTALALRALYISENKPVPPPQPPTDATPVQIGPSTSGTTTLTGIVTDSSTGQPVASADVSIAGTQLSAKTDSTGAYSIIGIDVLEFTLRASATGYDGKSYNLKTTEYGLYNFNISLSRTTIGSLRITSLSTDKGSYPANSAVSITATVENTGGTAASVLIAAQIKDSTGRVIAIVSPSSPNISISAMSSASVSVPWNTGQFAPGGYIVALKAIDPSTMGYGNPLGSVIAERAFGFEITLALSIEGGIALSPPVTQVGALTPVSISAAIRNTGNGSLDGTLRLTVTLSGGQTPVYSAERAVTALPVNNVLSIDFGGFTPEVGGNYAVALSALEPSVSGTISKTLYVGKNARATFTVLPTRALPGNVKVSGKIHIEGAGIQNAAVQDPMVPLIKSAIQKGVNYSQIEVMRWHTYFQCNGCHIQTQALAGLELSRGKVGMYEGVSQTLFNAIKGWQAADGSISKGYDYYIVETQLGLWSLIYWHDQTEAMPIITKAADYLLKYQNPDGSWYTDYSCCWWSDAVSTTAITMMGIARAYELSGKGNYLTSLTRAVQYMVAPGRVPSDFNMTRAQQIIGLEAAINNITDTILKSNAQTTIDSAVQTLKSAQYRDGGWGGMPGYFWSDSLVTAQVLYALLKAGVPGDDPVVRKAIQFLLNTQRPDGSWYSQNYIMSTNLAATTWVIMSLPIAYEKVAGIDADVHVKFPSNVALNSSNPLPSAQAGSDYTWKLSGLDEAGKDIDLDLTLNSLSINESRKAAEEAFLTFKNTYTGEIVNVPIDIPSVEGIAPLELDVQTDKTVYRANEDVKVTANIKNLDYNPRSPEVKIFIEDSSGNKVAEVASFTAGGLKSVLSPYRIPVQITAGWDMKNTLASVDVNFADAFGRLGISDKTIDKNSIRVFEFDSQGNLIGEKQINVDFETDTLAKVLWLIDGATAKYSTRHFYVYFDITENGSKMPTENTRVSKTGRLIAFTEDNGNIYIIESNGDGTFGTPRWIDDVSQSDSDYTRGIVLDDFNNDGFVDIVTGSGAKGDIYYYQNKADGSDTFMPKVLAGNIGISTVVTSNILGMTAADYNNDGNKDFIVNGNIAGQLVLYMGNGNGTFVKSSIEAPYNSHCSANNYFRGKSSADVDKDGNIDLIAANHCGHIFLYKGKGDGTFITPSDSLLDIGDSPFGLVAGDFDYDKTIDIIVNNGVTGDPYFIGYFDNKELMMKYYMPSLDTDNYTAYAAGDFNSDGYLDIIAAAYSNRTIEFYQGAGLGFKRNTTIAWTSYNTLGISSSVLSELYPSLGIPESVQSGVFDWLWNTAGLYPGIYKAHGILSENGTVIDEDYAAFEILPDKTLTSKVSTDKLTYSPNQTVAIVSTIQSKSANYIFNNLTARVTISNAQGQTLFTDVKPIQVLLRDQLTELKTYWSTAQSPKGIYTVNLEVLEGAFVLGTSTATLEILGSSKTGEGLRGTIKAAPNPVYQGKDETISYTVTNIGNEDINGLNIRVIIVDPDTGAVKAEAGGLHQIARGETISMVDVFQTGAFSPKVYLALLQVQTDEMTKPKALSSAAFEVKPGIEILKSIPDIPRVLVWLNYPWQSGQHCPDRAIIEKVLTEAGINYYIVLDKKDFERELSNPFYTDFIILGDHHPIEDHFSTELMRQVASGKGFISSLFNRLNLDKEVFRIKFVGHLPGGDYPVELAESELSTRAFFQSYGRSVKIRVEADGLTPDERTLGWLGVTTKKGMDYHPAIVKSRYGDGNVLYFAFDIGMSSANYEQVVDLLRNSFGFIHKPIDPDNLKPNRMIPVEISLRSLGGTFDIRATETVSGGLRIYDPVADQWATGNQLSNELRLEPNQSNSFLYYVLTPDNAGTYTLNTEVGYIEGGVYKFYQNISRVLTVE